MGLTFSKETHLDHGLTPAHLLYIAERFADRDGFFIETVQLPESLPALACTMYGPAAGDAPVPETDVHYAVRGARKYVSRLVTLPPRLTRTMTVIAGPHGANTCVLYTAYGGEMAPREPGEYPADDMSDEASLSRRFWAKHALAALPIRAASTKGTM